MMHADQINRNPATRPGLCTWGGSRQGSRRSQNQDAWGMDPAQGIYVLSDGMGGLAQGARASQVVVASMLGPLGPARGGDDFPAALLKQKAVQADQELFRLAGALGHQGNMGATLAALLISQGNYFVIWTGDSRIYRLRQGEMQQLSRDHTLVAEYLAQGMLSPQEAQNHPQRHTLTRAMGQGSMQPEQEQGKIRPGDWFILTSDGMHNVVQPHEMAAICGHAKDCARAGQELIELADKRQGSDDATVLLAAWSPAA